MFDLRTEESGIAGSTQVLREPEGKHAFSKFVKESGGYTIWSQSRQTMWDRPTGERWVTTVLVRATKDIPESSRKFYDSIRRHYLLDEE